ncbi:hypothetical protein B9479_000210 [Cryptococcus floricola]|uniref:Uncharacterized protein n=1 Tax=Cryptococcus floricola TaxID=2591691 RepID=A0A5D3B9B3_9TREE|nr:hypothetical protein B9479_000210 [Cryptococcus floricola]
MFEEDFERCFICQGPSKGLYCSSDCRQKDQGMMSRAAPESGGVHITSQIPPALSPHMRPHHPSGLSPRSTKPRTTSNSTSSGSSSAVSSPLQSPRTNPIELDSPQKGLFNLPPPAYPSKQSFGVTSSVPMKIPSLASRTSPVFSAVGTPGSVGSTVYANNASIDTLRFGRRPAAVNSVTSPNALIPRCACGLPANHKGRSTSKDRADLFDSGFSRLSLNPPGTAKEEPISRSLRIVSDSAIPPFTLSPKVMPQAITPNTHVTPLNISEHPSPIAPTTHLSRSRSDPIPPSPQYNRIPPAPVVSNIAPPRRQSVITTPANCPGREHCCSGLRQSTNALDVTDVELPSRGRSRERTSHEDSEDCCMVTQTQHGVLNHPPEREAAPSRSRNRRDSARRSGTRSRSRVRERSRPREWTRELGMSRERPADGQISPKHHHLSPRQSEPQILPSWSRPQGLGLENGVAPGMRRTGSGQERRREGEREGRERGRGRSQEEERRARNQFGQVFGVAAG